MKIFYVTTLFLPFIDEYYDYLKEIREKGVLIYIGLFHDRFENALIEFLKLLSKYIILANLIGVFGRK